MKITKIPQSKVAFKPIEIKILIESQEEYDVLIDLTSYSIEVTKTVYASEFAPKKELINFLEELHEAL